MAAVAAPCAYVVYSQRRELRASHDAHDARQKFCFREWTFISSGLSLYGVDKKPKERERLAMRMLDRYESPTILELCAPGVKVDPTPAQNCWIWKGDPDCVQPFMQSVEEALRRWRPY